MFTNLFSPIKINALELPNRLVVAPMVTNYSTDGTVTDRYVEYVREKAKGGWGMIINEAHAVYEPGMAFDGMFALYDDHFMEGQKKLVEAAHNEGTKIAVQLIHGGRQSLYTKAQMKAPSPIADPTSAQTPAELTVEEIHEIIEAFGDAALRAKECGYDAIEVHGAHGYLILEFTSPYSNKRTDEYGGSLEGRARFSLEIIKNIRKKVGPDFPIIYRMSTDEYLPHALGITIADSLALATMYEEAGADALHSSIGNYTEIHYMLPPAAVRHGESGALSAELKKVVNIPVMNVGRYNDPYIADAAIKAGRCDIVTMARQSLADPFFPLKAKAGKTEDIRHCIGCQIGCVAHLYGPLPINCTVNPRLGWELEYNQIPEKADCVKNVVVVGGGVGGMQAAISSAERGHKVSLYEKSDRLGGQWNMAAMPPYKQEMTELVVWQKHRMEQLGVQVTLNKELTANDILEMAPDEVILATGAAPVTPKIKGIENDCVVSFADILTGKVVAGKNNAVIGGGDVGCETAAYLAMTNKKAEVFEMMDDVCASMEGSVKLFLMEYLEDKKVPIHTNAAVKEITKDSLIYEIDGDVKELKNLDHVIIAVGSGAYVPLKEELEGKISIHVVGDANSPRQGIEAVQEGHKIGKEI